jgi:hypothetical protein
MNEDNTDVSKQTCFVVMGFGKKTDFETGRVLDLDKSYKNMIKPAVEATGLICIRADEIAHSGIIDVPMYDQLFNANVVVADLSTSNKNAIYELGIRHALRPFTTVIIAEDGIKTFPFDINHIAIRQYHHLGEDIGFDEVMRFRQQLTAAIKEILDKNPRDKDSPVYTFLNDLIPPEFKKATEVNDKKTAEVDDQPSKDNVPAPAKPAAGIDLNAQTRSALMQQVDDAQKKGDWITAKALLTAIRNMINEEMKKKQEASTVITVLQQEDPYLLQRLALITYKSKSPDEQSALLEAHSLLSQLDPSVSNDTETLGLWGAVHKRLAEITTDITKKIAYLTEAIRAYGRGFYIRNDYYNGINYAFLLNVRANLVTDRAQAISDFVVARRVRNEVLQICEDWLKKNPLPDKEMPKEALNDYLKNWYWVKATKGEAYLGLEDEDNAQKELTEAYEKAPETWMRSTTEEQSAKLRSLLANSPLKYINNDI